MTACRRPVAARSPGPLAQGGHGAWGLRTDDTPSATVDATGSAGGRIVRSARALVGKVSQPCGRTWPWSSSASSVLSRNYSVGTTEWNRRDAKNAEKTDRRPAYAGSLNGDWLERTPTHDVLSKPCRSRGNEAQILGKPETPHVVSYSLERGPQVALCVLRVSAVGLEAPTAWIRLTLTFQA
jgi:hypothetical protein